MPPTNKALDNDNINDYFNDYTNRIFNNGFFTGFVTGVVTGVFSTTIIFSIFHKCAPKSFLYGSKIIKL
jgi:hypothetical protein